VHPRPLVNCDGLHTIAQTMLSRRVGDVEEDTLTRVLGGSRRPLGLSAPAGSRCQDSTVEAPDVARAIDAALSIARALDLPADDATVLQSSNRVALHLRPCDVVARVAPVGRAVAALEVELARRLADVGCPIGTLEPRVAPRVYEGDGYAVTLWTYYEPTGSALLPRAYADTLERLHAGMRELDVPTPHFTDRVASAEQLVTTCDLSPELPDEDREMLTTTLRRLRRLIGESGAPEQLLHGEPHPGNVLSTASGLRFVDLETGCRGPVEFYLAHVPETVSERYANTDDGLLRDCRQLVLAMVAAWRWELGDQLPNGIAFGRDLLSALRAGPPWPTLDDVFGRLRAP
jgi:hypothetical protein